MNFTGPGDPSRLPLAGMRRGLATTYPGTSPSTHASRHLPTGCRLKTVVTVKKSFEIPFPKLLNNLSGIFCPIANGPTSIFGKPPHIYR
jgi:hypothetical protein